MNTTAVDVSTRLQKHLETVSPGKPFGFTSAAQPGDGVWQGDLGLEIVAKVPAGYKHVKSPTNAHRQLVPEAGAGSHHRLDSLDGVEVYHPPGYDDPGYEGLDGPVLRITKDREVKHEPGHAHPHGTVSIPAGLIVKCRYQRNWDAEKRRERRARD